MSLLEFVNLKLSILTVLSQAFIIFSVVYFIFFRKQYNFIQKYFSENALIFSFIVALGAMLGSLFYSEVVGYEPCILCWYQRIFMYPEVVILGTALFKKDSGAIIYSLILSVIGALLAGYHYLLQLGLVSALPCSAVGYSVSCSKMFILQFGYITLPLMSLTAFSLIIIFCLYRKIK
jgi:disulfide bond formation protein DsbB